MHQGDGRPARSDRATARRRTSSGKGSGVALVLAGGGARGAYEVGALSVLVPALERRGELPCIFVGTSVGAINAVSLAATGHLSAREAVERQLARWHEVDSDAVIRPIIQRLPLTALRFLGGLAGLPGVHLDSLLDPGPLRENLRRWIDWRQLHRNTGTAHVSSVAVVATAAATGRSVAFVEGDSRPARPGLQMIDYVQARVREMHVLASAAIPILFPPVHVTRPAEAGGWYVDGGTRLNTPIKPAIELGAKRIVVIATGSAVPPPRLVPPTKAAPPNFGVGARHLLQGALADPLVEDIRKLGDVNSFYADHSRSPAAVRLRRSHGRPPYRRIPYIFIAPSRPSAIAELATEVFAERYGGLKALRSPDLAMLGRLLGGAGPSHGELLSYLLFDREFIAQLIELGRADALAWLNQPPGPDQPWQVEPLDAFKVSARAALSSGERHG